VNNQGENQVYCVPGINDDFSAADLDQAEPLFEGSADKGILTLTLEMPLDTAVHAMRKARSHRLRVVLDPGGINASQDVQDLLQEGIYCIKPNEHEAKILTGIEVTGFPTAEEAARRLLGYGIRHVLITHGSKGAYLFSSGTAEHFPVPTVAVGKGTDETGCGDQATAVLCVETLRDKPIDQAARLAIYAGTLQFHRRGIQPVHPQEIEGYHG
jgi:ribokinase